MTYLHLSRIKTETDTFISLQRPLSFPHFSLPPFTLADLCFPLPINIEIYIGLYGLSYLNFQNSVHCSLSPCLPKQAETATSTKAITPKGHVVMQIATALPLGPILKNDCSSHRKGLSCLNTHTSQNTTEIDSCLHIDSKDTSV